MIPGQIGFRSLEPGAGERLLLKDCRAEVHTKGQFFRTHTGIGDYQGLFSWFSRVGYQAVVGVPS